MGKPSINSTASGGAWADAHVFTRGQASAAERLWRLLWYLIKPPQGNQTVPTFAGCALVIVAIGIGSAAYNNASNILFMTLSLMLSSLVVSGLLSWQNLRGAKWRLVCPPHFREGESAALRIELLNGKKVLPTYCLGFRVEAVRARQQGTVFQEARLDGGATLGLSWVFQGAQRGVEVVRISGVESQFPFGFLRKVVAGGMECPVRVWPGRVAYTFSIPGNRHARKAGESRRRPGPGAELLGLRPYRAGDAPRLVHWKASARLRELVVRQTGEETEECFTLHLETRAEAWRDDAQFELLCRAAATLAEDLFREGRLAAVAVNDMPVAPIKRLADLHAFLDELAVLDRVPHVGPATLASGASTITFRPGLHGAVDIFLGGHVAGSA